MPKYPDEYNVYCDESCHIQNDHIPYMLIGGIWCPREIVPDISRQIREIKRRNRANGELKWSKVSRSKQTFYLELVDYFFSTFGLCFRCVLVKNKFDLDHDFFNKGSHDSFYYKTYYYMLLNILKKNHIFNVYIDIKDTNGYEKTKTLKRCLTSTIGDCEGNSVRKIQIIRSEESELIQLTDLFIGAIGYNARELKSNDAKAAVVNRIKRLSGHLLTVSTPPWEEKFNLFLFTPRKTYCENA